MANFIIKAQISIESSKVRSKADAKRVLSVMLNDYADMNEDCADVCIHLDDIKKVS